MPEHMMMKPVFFGGDLFGFVGNIGHVAEIGGMAPGSFAAEATDIYQEGLRLPPVKLMRQGEYVEDVWKIIQANHRTPRHTWGDFHAMIGSLNVGERRLHQLVAKYGADFINRGTAALMDYSERRMRAEIAEIPNGEYLAEMLLEDDGIRAERIPVKVKLVVQGDEVTADFTGSSPQVRGPINCTLVVVAAAVYNAVFCVTDPKSTIPRNSGCYRPIKFIAPPGTVVNVQHPGACVAGNTDTQPKLIDLLLAAFSQAVPERIAAASGGSSSNLLFGGVHPETGEYYSNYHFDGMGTGATMKKDGNSAEITRHSNCRNTPLEVFESRYPFRTLEYNLVTDSGGPGRYRGGLGVRRVLEVTAEEITVSAVFDRAKIPGWGLFDGRPGSKTKLLVKRQGDDRFRTFAEAFGKISPTKFTNVTVSRGDLILYQTPGGGGFGDSWTRNPQQVLEDVCEGLVSPAVVREQYGVVLRQVEGGYALDEEATQVLRSEQVS